MFHIHAFPDVCGRRFRSSHNPVTCLLQHYIKSIWSRSCSWILREFPFYSPCLYFIHLSPLDFLFYATEIRFLRTDGFCIALWKQTALRVGPIPPRHLISQLPFSNNPWLSYIYLSPQTITLFFWKKRLAGLQILADFSGRVEQRNLFHSSAFLKRETSWTCLRQHFAESHFRLHASFSQSLLPSPGLGINIF